MILFLLVILGLATIIGFAFTGALIQDEEYVDAFATFAASFIMGLTFIALFTEVVQQQIKTSVPAKIEYKITEVEGQRDTTYIYHFK